MKKFNLAGCTWEVVDTEMPDLGCTMPDDFKILLRSDMSKQNREVTLWHEVVHAILFTMGWRRQPHATGLYLYLVYNLLLNIILHESGLVQPRSGMSVSTTSHVQPASLNFFIWRLPHLTCFTAQPQ